MRLIIAEKPSLARAIAESFEFEKKSNKLYIDMSNGDTITWAAGHIFELATPESYDVKYKSWNLTTLPIIPEQWKLQEKKGSSDLVANIKSLLKNANSVIHAGDADREGQLLIDEILQYFNYQGKVQRVLLTDLTPAAVRKAFDNLRDNDEFKGLYQAALARQRGDWTVGINLSRAYSIIVGNGSVVSLGRVQTPTLALVVNRDKEIADFTSRPFYEVKVKFVVKDGEFFAKWYPDENKIPLDEKGRLLDSSIAQRFSKEIIGEIGNVSVFEKKDVKSQPPLIHTLATLQIECSKKYDFAPEKTLALLQKLYEAKVVSYPRSDCAYIPETLLENRMAAIEAGIEMCPALSSFRSEIDFDRKSKSWNDVKVQEHHGIIPTGTISKNLSADEAQILDAVIRRFISQFYPDQVHAQVLIEVSIKEEVFKTSSKREIEPGWKSLYKNEGNDQEDEKELIQVLPETFVGEITAVRTANVEEKKTTPPEHFTEATLLEAMNNIHRFVSDDAIRKLLKETSGLGTAATQANIIATLFRRGFIEKKGKKVLATGSGTNLITVAPPELCKPDITAFWEKKLRDIQDNTGDYKEFFSLIVQDVRLMIDHVKTNPILAVKAPAEKKPPVPIKQNNCPSCGKSKMELRQGKNGNFWVCYSCGLAVNDNKGKPQKVIKCPKCGKIAVEIVGKYGAFWACRSQECKHSFNEKKTGVKKS